MKQITFSVPTGSFPALEGDRVRVSLTETWLDVIEALVIDLTTGCGNADSVTLEYDDTIITLSRCNLYGFQLICDCCSARPCVEVFAPTEIVENITRYVMTLPGPFRLDQIKFFSPDAEPVAYSEQIVDELDDPVVDQNNELLTT